MTTLAPPPPVQPGPRAAELPAAEEEPAARLGPWVTTMNIRKIYAEIGTLALIGLSLAACGSASRSPSTSAASTSASATTPQQQLASKIVGTTDAQGASVTSATVGTMCSQKIPADAAGTPVDGCGSDAATPFVPLTSWQQKGTISFASGEVFLSDGTQENVSVCVDGNGNVTWSTGQCLIQIPAAPAAAPVPATTAPAALREPLTTRTIGGQQVLTDSSGFSLYWFAPDTSTTSKCTGSCATYWPPVAGPSPAGSASPAR